jgi:hypothetical protein
MQTSLTVPALREEPLHLSEIAAVLGWTLDRIQAAAEQLAT